MTLQALAPEGWEPSAPQHTFFKRFGYLGICVLPPEVLDDASLPDQDTGILQPSLRQRCSQDGQLCYAQVLEHFTHDLYWADVAATPDLAHAERVMLTEAQLIYALAWDKRLSWRTPAQIRRLMQVQAEDLAPRSYCSEPEPPAALFPAPLVPLTIVTTVEVTPEELRAAFGLQQAPHPSDAPIRPRPTGVHAVQQGLLCALARTLEEWLSTETDSSTIRKLHALTALVKRVARWQQQTRQRVVNAVRAWDSASNGLVWSLTLGVPQALLGAA